MRIVALVSLAAGGAAGSGVMLLGQIFVARPEWGGFVPLAAMSIGLSVAIPSALLAAILHRSAVSGSS